MEEFIKRIKAGLWVATGGFVVTTLGVVLQNLDLLHLTDFEKVMYTAVLTGIVTQVTKWLNK